MGKGRKGKRAPVVRTDGAGQKRIPVPAEAPHPDRRKPAWRFGLMDWDGPWGWTTCESPIWRKVIERLREFEKFQWREVFGHQFGRQNHEVAQFRMCPEARRRLEELRLGDFEQVASLRIDGASRVWGVRIGRKCHLLWWDPEHQVCPSNVADN